MVVVVAGGGGGGGACGADEHILDGEVNGNDEKYNNITCAK
jgi:hypothetical protein